MGKWKSIETAPKVEGQYLLGFDEETARLHGARESGICIISWIETDDDEGGKWQAQPLADGLDYIDSEIYLTHWRHFPEPPAEEN